MRSPQLLDLVPLGDVRGRGLARCQFRDKIKQREGGLGTR